MPDQLSSATVELVHQISKSNTLQTTDLIHLVLKKLSRRYVILQLKFQEFFGRGSICDILQVLKNIYVAVRESKWIERARHSTRENSRGTW